MEIKKGSVVIAKAGRDKGKAFTVVDVENNRSVWIADGKRRSLDRPKRKNVIHLQATAALYDGEMTNRQLRIFLKEYTGGK